MNIYHLGEPSRCPGCGQQHWIIGVITAECGRCSTALPLADSRSKPAPRIQHKNMGKAA